MNSDKKFGILIGLILIFVFVFVIGKLPSLQSDDEGAEPAQTLMSAQVDPHGVGALEKQAQQSMDPFPRRTEPVLITRNDQSLQPQMDSSGTQAEVRIILPLPETERQGPTMFPVTGPEVQGPDPVVASPATLTEPVWPKAYVVKSGDNLALIAKQFYGPTEGNRLKNIEKLFDANRRLLRKPDQIRVGQKLVVPPLNPLASKALQAVTVPVRSVGEALQEKTQPSQAMQQAQNQWYVVRDGDSLWKIASAQLGKGERYTEIASINETILKDEDHLPVGLRLKLPVL